MAGSIQFKGKEMVMQMYRDKDVDAWAIFEHKQFIHKGSGDADLNSFLDLLTQGGTNAIYTLKVYEDITDLKKIKEKTECDGSFNFRLNDERQEITGAQYGAVNRYQSLEQQILELKGIILELKEERELDETEDDHKSLGNVLMDTLASAIADPEKAKQWVDLFKSFNAPDLPGYQSMAPVRNIPAPGAAAVGNIPPDKDALAERLCNAVNILEKKDPKLVDHIEKLASISENDPDQFKFLLSLLDKM